MTALLAKIGKAITRRRDLTYFGCFWADGKLYGHPVHTPGGVDYIVRIGYRDGAGAIYLHEPEPVPAV